MTIKKETKKIEAYTTPKNSSIGSIGDLIAGPFIAGKKKRAPYFFNPRTLFF